MRLGPALMVSVGSVRIGSGQPDCSGDRCLVRSVRSVGRSVGRSWRVCGVEWGCLLRLSSLRRVVVV